MSVLAAEHGSVRSDSVMVLASVLIHAVVALVIVRTDLARTHSAGGASLPDVGSTAVPEPEEQKKDRLGLDRASSASIDWLGIEAPDPVEGRAAESSVDQAAQTPVLGDSVVASAPQPVPAPSPVEEPAPEPTIDTQAPERESRDPVTTAPAPDDPAPADKVEGEAVPDETPIEVAPLEGPAPEDAVVIPEASEPREDTESEGVNPEPVEPEVPSETPSERVQDETDPVPNEEGDDSEPVTSAPSPSVKTPSPTNLGLRGVVTDREVLATAIKRAIEVDPRKPNAPVAGEGLEITTVMPRWSSTGRNTGAPLNPVVVMHFDARGRVVYADFLKEPKREYSSGSLLIDEPLMNAVYRWRAKGERIDELDARNPRDTVEVTITFLFNK